MQKKLKNFNIYKNSSNIKFNINQKNHFFPSDFFEPISSGANSNQIKSINSINSNRTKSTFINLQKEEEEDKELLDLLEGKRKKNIFNFFLILFFYISLFKSK